MNTAHHYQSQAPIYYYEAPIGSSTKHGYVDVYEHSYGVQQQQVQQPVSKKQRLVTYEYTPLQSHNVSQHYNYDFSNSSVNNGYTQQQVQFNIGTTESPMMHYNSNNNLSPHYNNNHGNGYISTPTKSVVPMTQHQHQQQPAYISMHNNSNLQYNQQYQQIVSPVPVEPIVTTTTPELEVVETAADSLVRPGDKPLITDYFCYLIQQFQPCHFRASDRSSRGGKRDAIPVGFAGLQCRFCNNSEHCTKGRKFFWSDVERLANSFSEFTSHLFKCRDCPTPVKDALYELKKSHSIQLAKLPRGSQKTFLRRLWRRLHANDDEMIGNAANNGNGVAKRRGSDASASTLGTQQQLSDSTNPVLDGKIVLGNAEDKDWLSDMDCILRQNVEVFEADNDDIAQAKFPIVLGQVGLRCLHCSSCSNAATTCSSRASSTHNHTFYPLAINDMYEMMKSFQEHLEACPNLPQSTLEQLVGASKTRSLSSVTKRYFIQASHKLGLRDFPEGIRLCKPVDNTPVSTPPPSSVVPSGAAARAVVPPGSPTQALDMIAGVATVLKAAESSSSNVLY